MNTETKSEEAGARQNEAVRLVLGDSAERLKLLEAGSVGLTVTSPPYDNLRTYNGALREWSGTKWQEIIRELFRVTKHGGVVVWVVADATIEGSETGTSFRQALYAKECGFRLHDTMIYHREGPPKTHNRYEQKFEFMLVWSKGKPEIFNGIKEPSLFPGKKRCGGMRQDGDELTYRNTGGRVAEEKLKGNVWTYAVNPLGSNVDPLVRQHPAVFPEALASDHILTWSNEETLVLDPFMGSGTTGVAALKLGRRFIGIEIDDGYFAIAQQRIREHAERLLQSPLEPLTQHRKDR